MKLASAVGTFYIRHILNYSEDRNIHEIRHIYCFFDNHRNKLLRSRLKDRQRNVTGSGRHIDVHIVYVIPYDIRPELLYGSRNHGTAPDDRSCLIFKEKIDRHHLYPGFRFKRQECISRGKDFTLCAESLRYRRTRYIRIENRSSVIASACEDGQHRRYDRLSYAALTAHDTDDMLHRACGI